MDYDTFKRIKDTLRGLKIEFIILVFETEWISVMGARRNDRSKVNSTSSFLEVFIGISCAHFRRMCIGENMVGSYVLGTETNILDLVV